MAESEGPLSSAHVEDGNAETAISTDETLLDSEHLKNNAHLWYRTLTFIYDLRSFRNRRESETRLNNVIDPFYIGAPYFTVDEAGMIKNVAVKTAAGEKKRLTVVVEDTVRTRLERRAQKAKNKDDYRPCTAHDLSPVFEKAFGVSWKPLTKNPAFVQVIEQYGLDVPTEVASQSIKTLSVKPGSAFNLQPAQNTQTGKYSVQGQSQNKKRKRKKGKKR